MKKRTIISCALLLFFNFQMALLAQTSAIWQGGKPGKATDWNCAANWKEGKLPNDFCQVLIPAGRTFYPVIQGEVPPIDALLIESDACLTLLSGSSLCILGETGRLGGIILLGEIRNHGRLELAKFPPWNIAQLERIQGEGVIVHCGKR